MALRPGRPLDKAQSDVRDIGEHLAGPLLDGIQDENAEAKQRELAEAFRTVPDLNDANRSQPADAAGVA
jgi:plasmid stabilization system protein ParE